MLRSTTTPGLEEELDRCEELGRGDDPLDNELPFCDDRDDWLDFPPELCEEPPPPEEPELAAISSAPSLGRPGRRPAGAPCAADLAVPACRHRRALGRQCKRVSLLYPSIRRAAPRPLTDSVALRCALIGSGRISTSPVCLWEYPAAVRPNRPAVATVNRLIPFYAGPRRIANPAHADLPKVYMHDLTPG